MKYTNDEIYNLVKKLSQLNISELKVKSDDLMIKIKNGQSAAYVKQPEVIAQINENEQESMAEEAAEKPGKEIAAPIHGTYYASPGPDDPPYIKVGDKVKKGSPICILEAMKMMNTINMPEDGVILAIEVANEDIVDTGQALVRYDSI